MDKEYHQLKGVEKESRDLPFGPFVAVALGWIAGILIGQLVHSALIWSMAALLACVPLLHMYRRGRNREIACWALAVLVPLSAGWSVLRQHHVKRDHVTQFIEPVSTLGKFRGTVEGKPDLGPAQGGAFAHLHWTPPVTRFVLRLDGIVTENE